jgi:phage terminase small subunit
MALNNKRKAFVEAYLRCWNANQAAKDAGYSERSAYSTGPRLLSNDEVQAYIQKRLTEMKMSADEVLLLLADHARASLKPFTKVTDEGFVYFDFNQPGAMEHFHLIKKIKSKRSRRIEGRGDNAEAWEDETVEVELHDAQSALDKLGRHHKLFEDKPVVNLQVNFEGLEAILNKAYSNGDGSKSG